MGQIYLFFWNNNIIQGTNVRYLMLIYIFNANTVCILA